MANLGSDSKLDIATLSSKILLAIAGGIAKQGTGLLPKDMLGSLSSELKRLEGLTEALLESGKVLETGKDISEGAAEVGKEVKDKATDAIKGLFKPKEEE
jgi:hypothetical protein